MTGSLTAKPFLVKADGAPVAPVLQPTPGATSTGSAGGEFLSAAELEQGPRLTFHL